MATIYSLPPEIHACIVPYLSDADLREYRLVCKEMAAVGAKEYFRLVVFHASSASVRRLQTIAEDEYLRKCIQTLVWDSNLWNINVAGEAEWAQYLLEDNHRLYLHDNYSALSPGSIVLSREIEEQVNDIDAHIQVYKKRRRDEIRTLRKLLQQDGFLALIKRFSALREVRVVNGEFNIQDRRLRKTRKMIERNTLDLIPRGDNLFDPDLAEGPLGVHAFTSVVAGMSTLNRPWKLGMDAIDYTFFAPELYPEGFEGKLSKLTSLALRLSYWRGGPFEPNGSRHDHFHECKALLKRGPLKHILRSLKLLRSLSLSLHQRPERGTLDAVASICDLIPMEENWVHLRELTLSYIDTSEEDFIRLMRNHSSTLKKLHLKDLCLVPEGSWIRVFEAVRPILHLNSAKFNASYLYGACEEEPGSLIWWLDGELGLALEKYLVSGGECPLREDNTVWHGVTSDGDPWELDNSFL